MKIISTRDFFDSTAEFYDDMISFDSALERRIELLKKFIKPEWKKATDLGCGSGMDSISVAKLGLDVNAFDISPAMIEKANANANRNNVNVNFNISSILKIPHSFYSNFSFITSLGNTLTVFNSKNLHSAANVLYKMLEPGGEILIQIINFKKVLSDKERIINITESSEWVFVRFYDFLNKSINFNILRFRKDNLREREIITTKLYPHFHEEMSSLFKTAGFKKITFYGSLNKKRFDPQMSSDLIINAVK
jgi:ubiquinone/menaquinone biosynthesis C-methylase UbiE